MKQKQQTAATSTQQQFTSRQRLNSPSLLTRQLSTATTGSVAAPIVSIATANGNSHISSSNSISSGHAAAPDDATLFVIKSVIDCLPYPTALVDIGDLHLVYSNKALVGLLDDAAQNEALSLHRLFPKHDFSSSSSSFTEHTTTTTTTTTTKLRTALNSNTEQLQLTDVELTLSRLANTDNYAIASIRQLITPSTRDQQQIPTIAHSPSPIPSPTPTISQLPSRYTSEFEEIQCLGRGGFGSVFRVRNRIDGQEYAVKKVKLRHSLISNGGGGLSGQVIGSPVDSAITGNEVLLREVQTFARISNHPNVVRYYAAWIEDTSAQQNQIVSNVSASLPNALSAGGRTRQRASSTLTDTHFSAQTTLPAEWTKYNNDIDFLDELDTSTAESTAILDDVLFHDDFAESSGVFEQDTQVGVSALSISGGGGAITTGKSTNSHPIPMPISTSNLQTSRFLGDDRNYAYSAPAGRAKKYNVASSSSSTTHANFASLASSSPTSHQQHAAGGTSVSTFHHSRKHSRRNSHPRLRKPKKHQGPYMTLYIQMQLVTPGSDLRKWLDNRPLGAIDYATNLKILRQIVDGVGYVHSKGFRHADIKPSNLFIQDGHVYLSDFGLSTSVLGEDSGDSWSVADSTAQQQQGNSKQSTATGTFLYSSPEHTTTTKSDMYSIGIVMIELFSHFATSMERALVLTEARGKPTPVLPVKLRETYGKVAAIIEKLLSPDPHFRPDAPQLLREIDAWIDALPNTHARSASICQPYAGDFVGAAATPTSKLHMAGIHRRWSSYEASINSNVLETSAPLAPNTVQQDLVDAVGTFVVKDKVTKTGQEEKVAKLQAEVDSMKKTLVDLQSKQ